MELFFLAILVLIMIAALASGYPVAFALPGSAIISIGLAAFLVIFLLAMLMLTSLSMVQPNGLLLVSQILEVITGTLRPTL
jgi:hypothetical protein